MISSFPEFMRTTNRIGNAISRQTNKTKSIKTFYSSGSDKNSVLMRSSIVNKRATHLIDFVRMNHGFVASLLLQILIKL